MTNNYQKNNHLWFDRSGAFKYIEEDIDNQIRISKVLNFLQEQENKKGKKILDIGCGDGFIGKEIKNFGYSVYGLEISEDNVKKAIKNGVKAKKGDVSKKFPFKDNSFDYLFAGEIIEHLFDTQFFISEIKRVLKKDGIVIITTPNLAHLPDRIKMLKGITPSQVHPLHKFIKLHIRPFTFGTMFESLAEQNFLVIKRESSTVVFKRNIKNPNIVERHSPLLAKLWPSLGSFIIIYAKNK